MPRTGLRTYFTVKDFRVAKRNLIYIMLESMETTFLSEKLMLDYVRETGCTMILVTHSLQQARRMADEVLYFHQGQLLEAGPKKVLLYHPSRPETMQFLEFYGI